MRKLPWLIGVFIGFVFVAAGTIADEKSKESMHSGFLVESTYLKLQDVQSASGQKAKRWISSEVTPDKYESLLLEKTVLYPEPQGTDQVSTATLNEISAYLDEALRRELAGVVQLATEPGPRTLRLKPAITAAATKEMGLKAYQYLPIAFIATRGKRGTGAVLAVEYEMQDSSTGEVVGAGMREGTGKELKSPTDQLTLDHVKPVIDVWANDVRAFIEAARTKK